MAAAVNVSAPGFDRLTAGVLMTGLALLFLPVYAELAQTIWASEEQRHGPIILAVSLWLLVRKRQAMARQPTRPMPALGWPLLLLALTTYALGRSQDIIMFALGSQIVLLVALLLIFKGVGGLRVAWFPLCFMLFMLPLPEALVAAATGPLKAAVSALATALLYHLGYPIARSGVVLTVGQYQLLVADACAGLNTMFTLEALGLLYLNLMHYHRVARNLALALLLVPVALLANVARVTLLVLVTFHFGDAAGQGFLHGFAGIVLLLIALVLMLSLDRLLGLRWPEPATSR